MQDAYKFAALVINPKADRAFHWRGNETEAYTSRGRRERRLLRCRRGCRGMLRQNRGKRRFFSARPGRWGGRFLCGCDSEESGGKDRGDRSNDPQSKHSIASSRLEKCCPAIRNRAEILH